MPENADLIALTVEVVASFMAHNELPAEDVAEFIRRAHAALATIGNPAETSRQPRPRYASRLSRSARVSLLRTIFSR